MSPATGAYTLVVTPSTAPLAAAQPLVRLVERSQVHVVERTSSGSLSVAV